LGTIITNLKDKPGSSGGDKKHLRKGGKRKKLVRLGEKARGQRGQGKRKLCKKEKKKNRVIPARNRKMGKRTSQKSKNSVV